MCGRQLRTAAIIAAAAHRCGTTKCARGVGTPFCKKRIEKGKGVGGGSSATHEAAKTGVYETAPGKTRPSLREGWSQPRLRKPDTEWKLRISYPWWNL